MALFKNQPQKGIADQPISSMISEGCILGGDLTAPAFVRIDGQVHGNVSVEGGIIIGEKGSIKGNVVTKQILIYGTVDGDVTADTLQISNTGKITGDITTGSIQMDQGAVFNGKLSMGA